MIVAVGSIAYDTIETWIDKKSYLLGGSASYFSVAASNFSKIDIVAVVGEDFKNEDFNLFKDKDIGIKNIKREKGKTFHWEGVYPQNGDAQTLKTELNVFENFNPQINEDLKSKPILFLGNIDPTLQYNVVKQMNSPKWVICDTMNYWIEKKKDDLLKTMSKVDILIINETEIKMLSEDKNLLRAVKKIKNMGPRIILVKYGARGAALFYKDKHFVIPATPVDKVIDPTGAGDTFAGGFIGYFASAIKENELSFEILKRATVYGNIMASFTIEGFGLDNLRKIDNNMIRERFNSFKKLVSF